MSFYTDYETIVPYNSSILKTTAQVSNVLADLLVAHAGCTLSRHATEGVSSSASNYAEVVYNGVYMRFYSTSESMGYLSVVLAYSANGKQIMTKDINFYYVTDSYVSVKIRFYNLKSGGFYFQYHSDGSWIDGIIGGPCTRISTGATYYFVSLSINMNAHIMVTDGLSLTYYFPYYSNLGAYDVDGTWQVLTQTFASTTTNDTSFAVRYMLTNIYSSAIMLMDGIVQIGNRYFYITGSYFAIELNS